MIVEGKILQADIYLQQFGYYPGVIVTLAVNHLRLQWSNGHSWVDIKNLTVEILASEEEKQVIFMVYPELKGRDL